MAGPFNRNRPKYWKQLLSSSDVEELITQAHRDAGRIKGRKVMFKSKSGKQFFNPAVGRQHDRDEAAGKGKEEKPRMESSMKDGEGDDHGPVHKMEIHHPDGAENPSPGKHHTVAHHEDGHEEHMDHDSSEGAHAHSQSQMMDQGLDEEHEPDEDDMAGMHEGGGEEDEDLEY